MPSEMSSPLFTLSNPAGLYDPTDNAYSHIAQVPFNARIVHHAGQGPVSFRSVSNVHRSNQHH